ncbi:MAG: DsrE family protein [Campylobacterales bacterium]|nr:DsrE family protein [Campylobacterales bacterium]
MSKTVIVILSNPQSGSEEALGRLFNALILGSELKQRNKIFEIIFQGTGTRWPFELENENHPAHSLYKDLKENIKGVCTGCAEVFGAKESIKNTGLMLMQEVALAGTSGVTDMAQYIENGDQFLTF